jgi:hypothetical protein
VIRRVFTDVLSKVKEETVCALPTSPYNTIMVLRFRNFRVRDQSKEVQLRTSGPTVSPTILTKLKCMATSNSRSFTIQVVQDLSGMNAC